MAEESAISAALRRCLFIVQIDVPEIFQNNSTNTPRLKRVFYANRLYATAGISQYRLINVAPSPVRRPHRGGQQGGVYRKSWYVSTHGRACDKIRSSSGELVAITVIL